MGQSLIRPQQADPDALFCAAADAGAGAAVPRCAVCTAAQQGRDGRHIDTCTGLAKSMVAGGFIWLTTASKV